MKTSTRTLKTGALLAVGAIVAMIGNSQVAIAKKTPTTWNVYPGDDIQAVIDGASPGDTIYFAAGTHDLGGTIYLTKSLKLTAPGPASIIRDPETRAVMDGEWSVHLTGGEFEIGPDVEAIEYSNLHCAGSLPAGTAEEIIVDHCSICSLNWGAFDVWSSATRKVTVTDTIATAEGNAVGVWEGADLVDVTVEYCLLQADHSGFISRSDPYPATFRTVTVRNNVLRGAYPLEFNWFTGVASASHNRVEVDRWFDEWSWAFGVMGISVQNSNSSGPMVFNQNRIVLTVYDPDDVAHERFGIIPISLGGAYFGPAYNVTFKNTTIEGAAHCVALLSGVPRIWDGPWPEQTIVRDCVLKNCRRGGLTLIEGPIDMYGVGREDMPGGPEYLLVGNTLDNVIIDNALPAAQIYDETDPDNTDGVYEGANILRGRLQHLYEAEGN